MTPLSAILAGLALFLGIAAIAARRVSARISAGEAEDFYGTGDRAWGDAPHIPPGLIIGQRGDIDWNKELAALRMRTRDGLISPAQARAEHGIIAIGWRDR